MHVRKVSLPKKLSTRKIHRFTTLDGVLNTFHYFLGDEANKIKESIAAVICVFLTMTLRVLLMGTENRVNHKTSTFGQKLVIGSSIGSASLSPSYAFLGVSVIAYLPRGDKRRPVDVIRIQGQQSISGKPVGRRVFY